jgi:hypothetical protein
VSFEDLDISWRNFTSRPPYPPSSEESFHLLHDEGGGLDDMGNSETRSRKNIAVGPLPPSTRTSRRSICSGSGTPPRFWLRRAKGSKHSVDNLAGKVWCGPALESPARDLEPDTDDDISSQFYILNGQALLGLSLGKIGLEVGANAISDAGGGLRALNDEPRPERLRDRLFQKFRQAKGQAGDGIRDTEPSGRDQVVKALPELGAGPRRSTPRCSGNGSKRFPSRRPRRRRSYRS